MVDLSRLDTKTFTLDRFVKVRKKTLEAGDLLIHQTHFWRLLPTQFPASPRNLRTLLGLPKSSWITEEGCPEIAFLSSYLETQTRILAYVSSRFPVSEFVDEDQVYLFREYLQTAIHEALQKRQISSEQLRI